MKSENALDRRQFLRTIAAGAAALTLPGAVLGMGSTAKSKRPNIVFIFADDMGWGDLGCYGHPRIKTPVLDNLAKQGQLFTQFYVNAPSCSPARAGFLTGLFPGRYGFHSALGGAKINKVLGLAARSAGCLRVTFGLVPNAEFEHIFLKEEHYV